MDSKAEFEALARPHVDALYRTALRMTGNAASAEDIVQEALVRAWRNFDGFQRGSNFKAWIFTILTNSCINEYRRAARGPRAVDFTQVEPAAPREDSYLSVEDVEGLKGRLGDEARKALARVPEDFRLVFVLATFEDMSYQEIAGVLGIPIGTVMSRLFRARALLRDELADFARREGFLRGRSTA